MAVGTAGLRTASNRDEVVAAIEAATGVTVNTISGEEESRLAYLAVRADLRLAEGALVVFDTGGGSTQFTFGHGAEVDDRFSVDVGAVRYTERFGLAAAVSTDALQAALDAIASDLHRLDGRPAPDALVGMGGAVTNITAVKLGLDPYDPDAVQGAILERADIDRQIEHVSVARRRRPSHDRRAPAQAGRRDPRRRVHRAHRHGEARAGHGDGERPRPATRAAHRALRVVCATMTVVVAEVSRPRLESRAGGRRRHAWPTAATVPG